MYLGYVEAQKRSTVESLAQSAAVSANAMYRRGAMASLNQAEIEAAIKGSLFLPNSLAYVVTVDRTAFTVTVQDASNSSITKTVNYR